MITKLISGIQVGADQAGIAAGLLLGIDTGGTAPKGYRTKFGNAHHFKQFGIIEDDSWAYSPRTEQNVQNSDGTIRFADDFTTAGELCTLKFIKRHKKPYIDFNVSEIKEKTVLPFDFTAWAAMNKIQVLNVAGNAGNTLNESNDIFMIVRDILCCWIKLYNKC